MPTPAQIVGEQGVESGFAATHGLLEEVSRLVALRYDLPETFDGLLQQLRVLHLDLLTLALPDEQNRTMRMRYSRPAMLFGLRFSWSFLASAWVKAQKSTLIQEENMSTKSFIENPIARGINEIRNSWGWFLAAGILLILFGTVCIVANVTATLATVFAFGWLLLLGGVVSLVQAFRVRNWKGFFLFLLNALLRGFTGYLLIRYPAAGAVSLTLVLASFFIVGGLFRAIASAMVELPGWGWSVFSGLVSLALGITLLVQMPVSSLWFIGFALGVDMIFDGGSLIAFATAIHSLPKPYETRAKAA